MPALYSVEHPIGEPVAPRVLLYHFDGAMDAGHAGSLAVEQLLMTLPSDRLATFDTDALIDYRARRPMLTFSSHSYLSAQMPELVLDLLQDDEGEDVLLLHGAEPDYRWQEFIGAVTHLAVSMGVSQAVAMAGMPLAVPHTRPTYVPGRPGGRRRRQPGGDRRPDRRAARGPRRRQCPGGPVRRRHARALRRRGALPAHGHAHGRRDRGPPGGLPRGQRGQRGRRGRRPRPGAGHRRRELSRRRGIRRARRPAAPPARLGAGGSPAPSSLRRATAR